MLFIFHLKEFLFIVLIFLGVCGRKQEQEELFYLTKHIEKLNPKDVLKYLGWVTITRQKKTAKKLKSESL